MGFKKDFVWGAATAAYQIEGAAYEDGKGLNIWDVFCKEPNKVYHQQSGDIACDHYHRFKEDVKLMKEIGLKAYRFSINWSRILPDGIGAINQKGIDFYNQLIDELIEYDIEPYITLYHWDLPYELYKKGGWLNSECVAWFGYFSEIISKNFSDRVKYYFTFNEPQCFIGNGYRNGDHAPGLKCSARDTLQMAHNVLKSHGQAVLKLREHAKQNIFVGYAPTGTVFYPASNSANDIEIARETTFSCPDIDNWSWNISWWSDPVMLGHYPEDGLRKYADYLPVITADDMQLIHQPLDFYGQNIYNGCKVQSDSANKLESVEQPIGSPKTAIQWPITPDCLYWAARFFNERYKKPLFITENGMSSHDWIGPDQKVHDISRINFLTSYLDSLKQAATEGYEIAGYFAWSLMDNFEWAQGYNDRFGIIYVDYATQKRTIKDSGYWYKKVIETNAEDLTALYPNYN